MSMLSVGLAVYVLLLAVLSLNGLHRFMLLVAFFRHRHAVRSPAPSVWPEVTVQLPMFNERWVAKRVIEQTARLDYPKDRLMIQVLDDSTDETTDIARACVDALVAEGFVAELRHRTDRTGFKAGALDEGLPHAKGDFIAVFDADFMPPPDFLRATIPSFTEGVGMVQARWGHLNHDHSWLTRAQATLLDGHFVIEHTARNASGNFFTFNGTAGVWRRAAIEEGGGWQHDTLTEDMDLSYRSQLAGWRFVYLLDEVAPAELPANITAYKSQQHRWAKGSVQVARKLLLRILRAPIPLATKLEATAHLTANFSYPLVLLLSLLMPFAVYARVQGGMETLLALDVFFFLAASIPFLLFYGVGIWYSGAPGRIGRLIRLPVVLALGIGMAVAQTRAVYQGVFGDVGVFVRTPKEGEAMVSTYKVSGHKLVWVEVALAIYMGSAVLFVASSGYWASVPFLLLFAGGFASVGFSSLRR